MAYQALYRRYRPRRFEDFVGQEAIIRTLSAQVMSGRIAHAYLFSGTRGTGKTSAAKVFARAINCEHPVGGDPCGECHTCRALEGDRSLDILEVDAASNNGVDEIRELRENIKYPPHDGRFRVYIIDEVHMLSAGAFNALLKTLEEPPAHAKFILATTEPRKLPATILSRCQRFDFRRIPAELIAGRLHKAMEENGVAAELSALERIARAAEGSMRDAWSITDMCLGYAEENAGGLTDALVRDVLGAADSEFLFRFADAMFKGDDAQVMFLIDGMMRTGKEAQIVLRDVGAHLRALLIARVCRDGSAKVLEVSEEDAAAYIAQADGASTERLLSMSRLFLTAEGEIKWSSQPRYILETTALRACAPEEKLQLFSIAERVAELERKLAGGVVLSEHQMAVKPMSKQPEWQPLNESPAKLSLAHVQNAPIIGAAQEGMAEKRKEKETDENEPDKPKCIWQQALSALRQQPMIYGLVRNAKLVSSKEDLFTVSLPRGTGAIVVNMLNDGQNNKQIAAAITDAAGHDCRFHAELEQDKPVVINEEEQQRLKNERLKKVFGFFGRENVRVLN